MMTNNEAKTSQSSTDEVIWRTFQEGNKQAFEALYQRYAKLLFEYGRRIWNDKDLVKDCIHDLFVDIWRNKENLSEPRCVKAYLISAIQRKLIRQLNRIETRHHEIAFLPANEVATCKEDELIEDQLALEQRHTVSKALNSLTERQKQAVFLKFYSNLSYKEIASIMSISVDSIYNLISKAIDILQSEVSKVPEHRI